MLDPQVDAVSAMADETAERMATLGVAPIGTPLFQWFVRAHLEGSGGELSTAGATSETTAAAEAGGAATRTK